MDFTVSVVADAPNTLCLKLMNCSTPSDFDGHIDQIRDQIQTQGWQQQSVYLIVDATRFNLHFDEVIQLMKTHLRRRHEIGGANDALTLGCLVGTTGMIRFVLQVLKKAIDRPIVLFDTVDEAVTFINTHHGYNNLVHSTNLTS